MQTVRLGRYRHFKGNEYEVIGVAKDSETLAPFVVYRALYGDSEQLWIRLSAVHGNRNASWPARNRHRSASAPALALRFPGPARTPTHHSDPETARSSHKCNQGA